MKTTTYIASALTLAAAPAFAGGIDRSGQSISALFEEGRYFELSFGAVAPNVSGDGNALLGGGSSGNMAPDFLQFGGAYKADIGGTQFSYAIILDQPFGADVDYAAGTGYFAAGSQAEFDSYALTGILRYKTPSNFSVYGGVRLQTVEASATVPFVSSYEVTGESDTGVGYLVGASYEIPDIRLRVDLTWFSEVDHSLATTETSAALGGPNTSTTEFSTPQSVNFNIRSGVAPGTLVFAGVRWVEWTEFSIDPADYTVLTGGGSLVSFRDDRVSYTLGAARVLSDKWTLVGSIGYERSTGSIVSNLGPTDGYRQASLGAIYTHDNMKVSAGVTYRDIGDAITTAGAVTPAGDFTDNDFWGVGVKVGWTF